MRSLSVVLHFVGGGKADSQRASERTSWGGTTPGRSTTAWRLPALIQMAVGRGYHQAKQGCRPLCNPFRGVWESCPRRALRPASMAVLVEPSESAVCLVQQQSTTTNLKGGPWTRKATLRCSSLFRGDVESRLVSVVLHHSFLALRRHFSTCWHLGRNLNACTGTGLARGCFFLTGAWGLFSTSLAYLKVGWLAHCLS